MENEKMMILKMLEDGKITATEASRLLESVGKTSAPTTGAKTMKTDTTSDSRNYRGTERDSARGVDRGFDNFAGDLSKKFESFAKDMEPKIQKFTEVVVETTVSAADKISKSLATSTTTSTYRPSPSPGSSTPEKIFEKTVTDSNSQMTITGLNGNIALKGYNGDKITAKVYTRSKGGRGTIELMQLGNKYFFSYDESSFESVSIDAYIPESLFSKISVQNNNGGINVSTLNVAYLSIENMNGFTELSGICSDNLSIETNNGNLKLQNISGKNAKIENFSGDITVMGLDVANLDMLTFNGAIAMTINEYARFKDYTWKVETGNAALTVNLPGSSALGYYLKAHTTLNNVRIGLTGLNYIHNDKTYAEARSINFDSCPTKVKLNLETSNGQLVVN